MNLYLRQMLYFSDLQSKFCYIVGGNIRKFILVMLS